MVRTNRSFPRPATDIPQRAAFDGPSVISASSTAEATSTVSTTSYGSDVVVITRTVQSGETLPTAAETTSTRVRQIVTSTTAVRRVSRTTAAAEEDVTTSARVRATSTTARVRQTASEEEAVSTTRPRRIATTSEEGGNSRRGLYATIEWSPSHQEVKRDLPWEKVEWQAVCGPLRQLPAKRGGGWEKIQFDAVAHDGEEVEKRSLPWEGIEWETSVEEVEEKKKEKRSGAWESIEFAKVAGSKRHLKEGRH